MVRAAQLPKRDGGFVYFHASFINCAPVSPSSLVAGLVLTSVVQLLFWEQDKIGKLNREKSKDGGKTEIASLQSMTNQRCLYSFKIQRGCYCLKQLFKAIDIGIGII